MLIEKNELLSEQIESVYQFQTKLTLNKYVYEVVKKFLENPKLYTLQSIQAFAYREEDGDFEEIFNLKNFDDLQDVQLAIEKVYDESLDTFVISLTCNKLQTEIEISLAENLCTLRIVSWDETINQSLSVLLEDLQIGRE